MSDFDFFFWLIIILSNKIMKVVLRWCCTKKLMGQNPSRVKFLEQKLGVELFFQGDVAFTFNASK